MTLIELLEKFKEHADLLAGLIITISRKLRRVQSPTSSNASGKSGSPSDFWLAGFLKRGFSTNNIHFHLIEINWCSSRVALFNVIEQSSFVAIDLEAIRRVLLDYTSYMRMRLTWCVWKSAFENVLQQCPQKTHMSISRHKTKNWFSFEVRWDLLSWKGSDSSSVDRSF